MCYSKSISFIEFCRNFYAYDKTCGKIATRFGKGVIKFERLKSGHILSVDKDLFFKLGHIVI